MQQTNYQTSFERHYTALLGMLTYFFTQLAEQLIEIAARAVMIFAPMPNAISMFNIVQREQGFTVLQALAFSFTLEIVVFLLVEIALVMWNGYLTNPRVYRWPFALMTGVVLVATFIVVFMVYALEPHKVMAWLPVVSLCSFVAIGLKRWHERNQAASDETESEQWQAESNRLLSQLDSLRNESDELRLQLDNVRTESDGWRRELDQLRTESSRLLSQLDRLRKQSDLSAVLSELSDKQRETVTEIVRLVAENRVTGPADLLTVSDLGKSTIYSMWPVAVASRAIYKNGDGAYHVNA